MAGDAYLVTVEGLDSLDDVRRLTPTILANARRAINKTVERTRTSSARKMREQIAFGPRYLTGKEGRLTTRPASGASLEGAVIGRARATSLAQFVQGNPIPGKRRTPLRVQVQAGRTTVLKKAFLIRLRAGKSPIETKFNLGLAIRLKAGETIANKKRMIRMAQGLYLLYGPSVDQVFASVADEEAPGAAAFLETEFLRLSNVDFNDG